MNKSLMTYFIILFLLCTGFVAGARTLGEMGVYLAGAYTLTPAMAALITRLFSIARASKMPVSNLAGSGITSSSGLFAWHYLIVLIFPGIISGFGEEFGHRGFMFPLLYPNDPWLSLLLGGFLFYLWHQPLLLVIPSGPEVPTLANNRNSC